MAEISWSKRAGKGLYAILKYHLDEDPTLAESIDRQINESIERLKTQPESSPVIYGNVRKLIIPKYSYHCFYTYSNGVVRILAIRHQKRNPATNPKA